jgi:radical SAM protein (TIGR01212 family)
MRIPDTPPYENFGPKRYRTWNHHLREKFGEKVFKVAIDGGFTCPNRDGTVAARGCTFCSQRGSGDFAGHRRDDLAQQFATVKARMNEKWREGKTIGYFQAFSNTYAPVSELREKFETILEQPGVVGLAVATRPDCLPPDVVEYLAELNERTYLWVELGLQTIHPKTSYLINRAHDLDCFIEGVQKLRDHDIRVCAHIINGLPLETHDMMLKTAQAVAQLDIQGIKIHLLHLLKKTAMVKQYEDSTLELMEKDDYINIVCDQLEVLSPEMIIHRLTGDGPPDLLIGPLWSLKKWEVLNAIDHELNRRDSYQGSLAAAPAAP